MKVTSSNNTELNATKKIENQSTNEFNSDLDGLMSNTSSEKSDFAGVLDKVTRAHHESPRRSAEHGSDRPAETRETKTGKEDQVDAEPYAAGSEVAQTREPVSVSEPGTETRPVLHTIDLEKIVTACQVQIATHGQPEVTLELSRSMLEGLRVKVSADATGRITADFLAANEGIKSLLDSRSAELIEQLRSRGINVAEFKSSVAADANDRNDARREHQPTARSERIASATETVASAGESEPLTTTEEGLASGATYRA